MRNLKKVLGLVLCLAMMLSIMVVGAGAAFADQSDIDTKHTEAVDMCNALNIITGFENGKFMPKDNVTREQMAKMICVLDNGGKEPQLATGNTFSDVAADRWSNKYIEACASRGVVVGVGGGKFAPAGKVTATQAAKMLLVELGYDDDLQKYTGSNWATNVNIDATKKGYYEDLEDIDVNAPLTREHAAQMIWNALQAVEVDYNYTLVTNPDGSISSKVTEGDKVVTDKDGKTSAVTLLADKYKGEVEEGILNGFKYDSNKQEWTYYVDGDTKIPAVKSSQDFTALLGQKVKVSYDNSGSAATKDAYGIFVTDSEIALEGQFGDLPKLTNRAETSFKVDGTTYKLDKALGVLPVYQFCDRFGEDYQGGNLFAIAGQDNRSQNITTYDAQKFIAVDQDGNGKIDFFMVTPFSIAKVSYVNNDKFRINAPITGDFARGPEITKEDVTVYDGIAKDDYVAIVDESNTADGTSVFTKVDLINGKVTKKDAPDVTIDGTDYTLDFNYANKDSVNAGTTLSDAAVYNGYIFAGDVTGNYDVTDFVIVLKTDKGAYANTAKLLFSDGSKKVVDLADPETDDDFLAVDSLKVGQLYTYDTNKDGEYQLSTAPINTVSKKTGFDYADGISDAIGTVTGQITTGLTVKPLSSSNSKAGYIGQYKIADDAVIFVKYNEKTAQGSGGSTSTTYSYKAITGATMKTMLAKNFGSNGNRGGMYLLATDNSSTGVGEVNLAYVINATATSISSDTTQYGYVTSVVQGRDEDDNPIFVVTMLTKDGKDTQINTVKCPNYQLPGDLNGLEAGKAIAYTTDSDGNMEKLVGSPDAVVVDPAAITGIDKGTKTIWYKSGTNTTSAELADDAAILIADLSEKEAVENNGTLDDISVADEPTSGNYTPNAIIILDDESKIAAVVYDVDNGVTSSSSSAQTLNITVGDPVSLGNSHQRTYTATISPSSKILPGEEVTVTVTRSGDTTYNDGIDVKFNGTSLGDQLTFTGSDTSKTVKFKPTANGTITLTAEENINQ